MDLMKHVVCYMQHIERNNCYFCLQLNCCCRKLLLLHSCKMSLLLDGFGEGCLVVRYWGKLCGTWWQEALPLWWILGFLHFVFISSGGITCLQTLRDWLLGLCLIMPWALLGSFLNVNAFSKIGKLPNSVYLPWSVLLESGSISCLCSWWSGALNGTKCFLRW